MNRLAGQISAGPSQHPPANYRFPALKNLPDYCWFKICILLFLIMSGTLINRFFFSRLATGNRQAGFSILWKFGLLCIFAGAPGVARSQTVNPSDTITKDSLIIADTVRPSSPKDSFLLRQYDVSDLARSLFHPGRKRDPNRRRSSVTIMPNIAGNPTIGAQIGVKAVAGKVLGKDTTTYMSVAATSASVTTKGIIYFYLSHNVFTPGNKWNLQGSLIAAKTVLPDFGLGIGNAANDSPENEILSNPGRKGYVLNAEFYSFREKIYKQIKGNIFLGAGVSFDVRRNIRDKISKSDSTPYNIYSDRYGFERDHYFANGLLLSAAYTTRDNQNNAYKGIYADVSLRFNQRWLGSSKNATQLTTDFRKYWSLSRRDPAHVIAFWNWGAYLLGGALPYLELPGTAKDPGGRSGRGYTVQYFKSTQYFYSETEYRFPILRNKFLSGVAFVNVQSANDEMGTNLFDRWQPGGGLGLRVLFNKSTRTNLCLDYAFGKYGRKGFFLNLNETF